ncbi:RidA family protein [Peptoniphilus sp. GNH]|nr:RidA family protein [Peptoniphilus sp. GNH]
MEIIQTKKAPAAVGPYCQGVSSQGKKLIFTSGQLPLCPESGELVTSSIKDATIRSLKNVLAVVEAGGGSLESIIKVNIYLNDINDFAAVNEVYEEFFKEHKPARSCLEVAKLPKGGLLEIEAIAEAN